jgi:hypothetical protein
MKNDEGGSTDLFLELLRGKKESVFIYYGALGQLRPGHV